MDKIFQIEPQDEFEKELNQILDSYCSRCGNKGFENSKQSNEAKELMKLLVASNFEINQLSVKLMEKGLHEDKISHFLSKFNEQKTELLYATLIHQNCEHYGETITSFDWVLKFVLGTSELNTLRYPVLQLLFKSIDSNGAQNKIQYDLNKDILLKTIDVLEKLDVS